MKTAIFRSVNSTARRAVTWNFVQFLLKNKRRFDQRIRNGVFNSIPDLYAPYRTSRLHVSLGRAGVSRRMQPGLWILNRLWQRGHS